MRITHLCTVLTLLCLADPASAQNQQRWKRLLGRADTNKDGMLGKDELEGVVPPRLLDRFLAGDTNGDGKLSQAEFQKVRPQRRPRARQRDGGPATMLPIPAIADLARVPAGERPPAQARRISAWVQKLVPHAVTGTRYVVLTDHQDEARLESLGRLAKHHDGIVVRVDDLTKVCRSEQVAKRLRSKLKRAQVRYLAIAPRTESYRENVVLGLWELASGLDEDPELDVFPGLLVASGPKQLAALVDRSIKHRPQKRESLRPFAISQVGSKNELRSLQKAGILRKMFAKQQIDTPIVALYTPRAAGAPTLSGAKLWNVQLPAQRRSLTEFPAAAKQALDAASLLVMHGHGVPGMSCSVDVAAIPEDISGKVILCGSCFSAAPKTSDFPKLRQAPGGFTVENKDAFAVRAIDHGAVAVFGHMRLNSGFPHLFPVLECWLDGATVGEGFQRLMNALIEKTGVQPGDFVGAPGKPATRSQNTLLYVVLGDPALQPFEQAKAKTKTKKAKD